MNLEEVCMNLKEDEHVAGSSHPLYSSNADTETNSFTLMYMSFKNIGYTAGHTPPKGTHDS